MNADYTLLYSLRSADDYVYHYCSARTLVDYILPTWQLRISRFSCTNDPREYKDWEFGTWTRRTDGDLPSGSEWYKQASNAAKQHVRILCTTHDDASGIGPPGLDVIYGRGFSRPRMWAQYSGNHGGACLILARNALDEDIRSVSDGEVYSGPVTYIDRGQASHPPAHMLDWDLGRQIGVEALVAGHIRKHHGELFFEKATDWSSEREYRWVVFLNNPTKDLYVRVGLALRGVVLGDLFSDADREKVHAALEETGIPIGRINFNFGIPEMRPSFAPGLSRKRGGWR